MATREFVSFFSLLSLLLLFISLVLKQDVMVQYMWMGSLTELSVSKIDFMKWNWNQLVAYLAGG